MALSNCRNPASSLYSLPINSSTSKVTTRVAFSLFPPRPASPSSLSGLPLFLSPAFPSRLSGLSRIAQLKPLMVGHKYMYPNPIPEFAIAETHKFRVELMKKLKKNRETFGDDCEEVLSVCSEVKIFNEFLCKEYGGPGTLLVEPFTDMLLALKEKKLPGAPIAARAALLWAQNNVDRDWEDWTSQNQR
ncbi:protein PLASTID REDOX INSENSITIVE 2, chloroplastic-like isoform X1 [Nymphaea colorata]|nr:protein PLASTID REDOX INSENSITIVE 2, chloroplastic-like isoform X1 [Nymphaea colorata]